MNEPPKASFPDLIECGRSFDPAIGPGLFVRLLDVGLDKQQRRLLSMHTGSRRRRMNVGQIEMCSQCSLNHL